MKNDLHGILYTLRADPHLRDLVTHRNSASIPFGGRYRLIDFALSSMVNAGARDVGVIMERDYQSLLDHLSNGKDWGLSRRNGGLRLLPPFGLRESHSGSFSGCMEALLSVRSYINEIPHEDIILSTGDYVGNVDLSAAVEQHLNMGAEVTAVCVDDWAEVPHHRYIPDKDGFSRRLSFSDGNRREGYGSTEIYILKKDLLLSLMEYCADGGYMHFHRDAMAHYLSCGGRVGIYVHEGYFRRIRTARDYFEASMEMIQKDVMAQFFPADRPVRTKDRAEVSTYYGDSASVHNCLVADGCYIDGEVRNCVLFRGVQIEKGAKLENCVVLQDTIIKTGAELRCVITDKDVVISEGSFLAGSARLPILIPKGETV